MREDDLRAVLLVQSIEEADREGTLIPPADRIAAARDAKRAGAGDDALARRAKTLLPKVVARHPFVGQVAALAGGAPWIAPLAIAGGLLVGLALSALDGTRRINVLAFPLLGLVLWNLAVYGAVLTSSIRSLRKRAPRARWLPSLAAHAAVARVSALIGRSRAFNAVLAEALARFLLEWQEAARPLLVARATRVFHLASAAVGIGLVAGLYLRGIAFAYQAGWESTFLEAPSVHALLSVLYGPASWLTGIAVPDVAHLDVIRWRDGRGGEEAARWIHLLAASAVLFVVLPRLALALASTASIARWSRDAPVPPSLAAYSRAAFGVVGGVVDRDTAVVVPFAYEPSTSSLARLRALLGAEMGERLAVDVRPPVPYGGEEAFLSVEAGRDGEPADAVVLLFSLAATPEEENHGLVMSGLRDRIAQSRSRSELGAILRSARPAERRGRASGPSVRRARVGTNAMAAAARLTARSTGVAQRGETPPVLRA